jgi:hypothetical protein
MVGAGRRPMAKRPYLKLGVGLIVVGAAFIALDLWWLSAVRWDAGPRGRKGGLIAIGLTLIVAGVMVLLGC